MTRFHRLAIRDHRPWRTVVRVLVLLAVVLVLAAVVYWRELGAALGALAESTADRAALERRVETLTRRNQDLAAKVAILEREAQIRNTAFRKVETDLVRQGRRIAELRNEIQFYRGIFSRSLKDETLGVHGLKLRSAGVDGTFAYRLVLTHMGKGDNVVKGTIELRVRGAQDGEPTALGTARLGPGARTDFSLKHFKQFDGEIVLPPGFVASQLEVSVRAGRDDKIRIDHRYPWDEVAD